jgi:hypothetical protein
MKKKVPKTSMMVKVSTYRKLQRAYARHVAKFVAKSRDDEKIVSKADYYDSVVEAGIKAIK